MKLLLTTALAATMMLTACASTPQTVVKVNNVEVNRKPKSEIKTEHIVIGAGLLLLGLSFAQRKDKTGDNSDIQRCRDTAQDEREWQSCK